MKIDGKQIAEKILDELKIKVANSKIKPHLAIVIVGNDPASESYVRQKQLKAEEIGAKTTLVSLESTISQQELISVIKKLNKDNAIHGIIVQKPLSQNFDDAKINESISPDKDLDNFNPRSKFNYPIGLAILKVLKEIYLDLKNIKNKKIVILGKGKTGGNPIKKTLEKLGISPIVVDSKTQNPNQIIGDADIVISAVGKKGVIRPEILTKNVVLIGAGQHIEDDLRFHGDYEEEKIKEIANFYTPTPGGVGPINVAMLLKNLITSLGNSLVK